jgi:hypothetical protein
VRVGLPGVWLGGATSDADDLADEDDVDAARRLLVDLENPSDHEHEPRPGLRLLHDLVIDALTLAELRQLHTASKRILERIESSIE